MNDRRLRRVGRILIWLGVAVWLPYAVMQYGLGRDISVLPWLGLHLGGVIPGSICVMTVRLRRHRAARYERRNGRYHVP